jgi:hypothetical protein
MSIDIFYYTAASIDEKASDYYTFHQFGDSCVSFSCLN